MFTFSEVCRDLGGTETKTGFEFSKPEAIEQLAAKYGHGIKVPPVLHGRGIVAEYIVSGLHLSARARKSDTDCNWSSTTRSGWWTLLLSAAFDLDYIRRLRRITPNGTGELGCWLAQENDGTWSYKSPSAIKTILQSRGLRKPDAEVAMGHLELHPWTQVCIPFGREYPGVREWNFGAARFLCEPVEGDYSTWNMIHDHIGRSVGGRAYMQQWIAAMLQDPTCRLPYLFLYGPENSGKSVFWESLELLMTGVFKADRALTSQSDFNGELEGTVLAIVEEKNISNYGGVLAKIKDAVTSPVLSIRRMHTDTYQVPNYTHWVQTANDHGACIVPIEDTRFTVLEVKRPAEDIAKPALLERLKAEAPAFLHAMLHLELPPITGRLRIPVVDTAGKQRIQADSTPALAHQIIEFMGGRKTWKGTAAEFATKFGVATPNIAQVRAAVDRVEPYLRLHGVSATYPEERTKRGKMIQLERAA
ncbi:MAG: hypothetical protein KF688_18045 [Pirellulales bacterium]|nr:hypothetical protein [Pirellulales bacterium]